MANPTTDDALREVIEALDHCMLASDPSVSAAYVRDTLPQHWLIIRRALDALKRVEGAPRCELVRQVPLEGWWLNGADDEAGALLIDGMVGKRVRLVLDP